MNKSKLFLFDLRNGVRYIARKFLILPLFVSLVCFEFTLHVEEIILLNPQYEGAQPTLGDFAMYLFGGMKPYIPNPDEPFLFPVAWFLTFGICLFLTLYYPVQDRETFGKMVIAYSGSRTKWWMSKCAWIITVTAVYFICCWIVLLINCLLSGGQLTLSVSPYMRDIFLLSETVPSDQWNLCHVLIFMPPIIASACSLLQMLLTLWLRPIICFLISAIIMLTSAYFCTPLLIVNYAFCIRSNEVLTDGFSFTVGVLYAFVFSLLCVFIGQHCFQNFDFY